jgi:hypothetical protein
MKKALEFLMPGNHSVQGLTRMSMAMPNRVITRDVSEGAIIGAAAMSPAVVEALFERLDFASVS